MAELDFSGDWIDLDESDQWDPSHFVIPAYLREGIASVMVPRGLILDRVERLAQQIVASEPGPLVMVCVLKGAFTFFAELAKQIKRYSSREGYEVPIRLEFIRAESYHGDKSGELQITSLTDLETFRGENLLLVEDIVDTGKTLVKLKAKLEKDCGAKSVRVATLVLKKTSRSNGFKPDYAGFAVPDLFLVGYGLDYNELGRELEHVCVVSEAGKAKYAKQPKA
ncbi:phosphoribosyltransferase-like protein [Hyaloraphidium curvatum]|nr:phosphoribosyltransferase-like protein [Hyaloraphidium curvatum]